LVGHLGLIITSRRLGIPAAITSRRLGIPAAITSRRLGIPAAITQKKKARFSLAGSLSLNAIF